MFYFVKDIRALKINPSIIVYDILVWHTFFSYYPPLASGYATEAKETSLDDYEYPNGRKWKTLFESGKYVDPSLKHKRLYPA